MCEGVIEGYTIKMKVVFAHFPITVKAQGNTVLIENFQGERSARLQNCWRYKVNPKGEDVIITGAVLTDVTQTAANIEQKPKSKIKIIEYFLDGIYIYEKKKGIEK